MRLVERNPGPVLWRLPLAARKRRQARLEGRDVVARAVRVHTHLELFDSQPGPAPQCHLS